MSRGVIEMEITLPACPSRHRHRFRLLAARIWFEIHVVPEQARKDLCPDGNGREHGTLGERWAGHSILMSPPALLVLTNQPSELDTAINV
jgi:hypothetical protein